MVDPYKLRYIQFIGTQRSGSNLLRVMLNQLPELSAPHPPHVLKTFMPLLPRYGALDRRANLAQLAADVCAWVNANPVSWEPYRAVPETVLSESVLPGLLGIFVAISEGKARSDGAQVWCCKSMETVAYMDRLEACGLHPVYIHLFRDGRDVALSFMKAVVGPKHAYALARKWDEEQRLALEWKSKLPQERFVSMRYEDLIREPEQELRRLCAAIGLPFRSAMLDYFESGESRRTAHAGKMWENLEKPVMASNTGKFRSGLSDRQLEVFEQVAGRTLAALGYPLVAGSGSDRAFTEKEIKEFEEENVLLIRKALAGAHPGDLEKRRPQEQLLQKILDRPPLT